MNKQTQEVIFSSKKEDYGTPKFLFDQLNREFQFGLDAAANEHNYTIDCYLSKESLISPWYTSSIGRRPVFLNPPWSRENKMPLEPWLKKSWEEAMINNMTVVVLIPAKPDTIWWRNYCLKAQEIRYIIGRLKFEGADAAAPFPSAVVIFKPYETYTDTQGCTIIKGNRKVRTRYWDPRINVYYGE